MCGWESHEVLGLTFAFMQGKNTDKRTTASFMTDIKAFGYARMSVINYRKDGQAFSATVTVRPIFDSICSVGVDANVPILTHFATTIADFTELEDGDTAPLPRTENLFSSDGYYRQAQTTESSGRGGGSACSGSGRRRSEHDDDSDTLMTYEGSEDGAEGAKGAETARSARGMPEFDSRVQSRKVTTASIMSAQDFIKYAAHLRLSDLCRLMVTCHNPIVLTDASGGILHVSESWVALTGYTLSEVEGYTCGFLQGPDTDRERVARCMADVRALRLGQMQVINYKKDGTAFNTAVIIHPLRGAYLSSGESPPQTRTPPHPHNPCLHLPVLIPVPPFPPLQRFLITSPC